MKNLLSLLLRLAVIILLMPTLFFTGLFAIVRILWTYWIYFAWDMAGEGHDKFIDWGYKKIRPDNKPNKDVKP